MVKQATSAWNGGTGIAVGGTGTLVLSTCSPLAGVLVVGVVLLLALTVSVVVLTAARGRDQWQQCNSAAVLDLLMHVIFHKGPPEP